MTNLNKKTYIFDLDGTLVNSLYDLADSMNSVLEESGFPIYDTEKYRYFVGNGTMKLVERTLPERLRTEENIALYHRKFAAEYERRCLNKTRPYDGIIPILEKLKSEGAVLAVASNKPHEFAGYIVKNLFEDNLFDVVMGKKDGVPTKPSPDIIKSIFTYTSTSEKESLMVGDSDVDVLTAHNAGIKCCGVLWGFRTKEELERAGADYFASEPEDILKIKI